MLDAPARRLLLVVFAALAACCLWAAGAGTAGAQIAAPEDQALAGPVLVVGDSLAVGLEPYLGDMLGPDLTWDAVSGRTTPQGLIALRTRLRRVRPRTVVVSLGTNDGPDPARFAQRLHKALAVIPSDACIVWTAIYRPARKGAYLALNRVLRGEAHLDRRLVIVNWDRAVAGRSVTLPDGLHPDSPGFAYRSRMIAAAVHAGCGVRAAA